MLYSIFYCFSVDVCLFFCFLIFLFSYFRPIANGIESKVLVVKYVIICNIVAFVCRLLTIVCRSFAA